MDIAETHGQIARGRAEGSLVCAPSVVLGSHSQPNLLQGISASSAFHTSWRSTANPCTGSFSDMYNVDSARVSQILARGGPSRYLGDCVVCPVPCPVSSRAPGGKWDCGQPVRIKAGQGWSNSKHVLRVFLSGLSCHRGINKPSVSAAENKPFYKLLDPVLVSFLLCILGEASGLNIVSRKESCGQYSIESGL